MIGECSEAFLLGLAAGPTCLATCAGPFASSLAAEERERAPALAFLGWLLAGRFAAYLLVGAAASLLGGAFGGSLPPLAAALAMMAAGSLLLLYGARLEFTHSFLCRSLGGLVPMRQYPFVLGFLFSSGLCPPLGALAVSVFVSGAGPAGLLPFLAFFVATSLFLVPLALLGRAARRESVRTTARLVAILMGAWLVLQGFLRLPGNPSP